MKDYISLNREAATFTLTPQQQAAIIAMLEPFFEDLVERMALRTKQLVEAAKPRFYERRELAELLHVSMTTLYSYVRDGKLTVRKINGKIMFSIEEVNNLIESMAMPKRTQKRKKTEAEPLPDFDEPLELDSFMGEDDSLRCGI